MSPRLTDRWSAWLPEFFVLLSWWCAASGFGWWFSWDLANPAQPSVLGYNVTGFAYVAVLASYWVFGDPRGPLQSLLGWFAFLLFIGATSATVFLFAANGAVPTSLAELESIGAIFEERWPSRHAWNVAMTQGFLLVTIPFGVWLACGVFSQLSQGYSRKQFREQMLARNARLILLCLTVLALGYVYVRQRASFQYPYATSREIDTHALVLRYATAVGIAQWLFVKALEMLQRPMMKLLMPLLLFWLPLIFENQFRWLRQMLPIQGFGRIEYDFAFNLLWGATIYATGLLLALAWAQRLPRQDSATANIHGATTPSSQSMLERKQPFAMCQPFAMWMAITLAWLAGLGVVLWLPQAIEPGEFFSTSRNRWSQARVHAELRRYYDRERVSLRGKQRTQRVSESMVWGSNDWSDSWLLYADPQLALDPQLNEILARLEINRIIVSINTTDCRYTVPELLKLQQFGFRNLPPTTWEELQQNPNAASALFVNGTSIRDSHITAATLDQLGLLGNYHTFTRCTFSRDFLASITPETAAHFSFKGCLQPELLDLNARSVSLHYADLETAPLRREDWRRIAGQPSISVMIENLPEVLPDYLRIGREYYYNEVEYVDPNDQGSLSE